MRYSRTGIIIALIGAEIFIAGAILAALGAPHSAGASQLHGVAFTARAVEPIDAGDAPRVRIDDADSTVTVSTSPDGRVHVIDNSRLGGPIWGTRDLPQLQVERTSDGVNVSRPDAGGATYFMFGGWEDRRITVQVPQKANVDVIACSGAEITGLAGSVRVRSQDGAITVRDLTADADLQSDDGHIDAANIHAKSLSVSTNDGELRLRDVTVDRLQGSTQDGLISASGLQVGGGSLSTNDGGIELSFLPANLSIHAQTSDGNVTFDGRKMGSNDDDDSSSGDFHIGAGGGSLQVATQDGDIHILTNGAS
ncbi:MAG TPA: DUF4097 family beta strand repeat-containing protein [Candidatus Baltobacteraceae bacterium]|jgi:hypothetical protein|nr:DUF4097 family beta strand repeat-containing protein [Candidatus Baltobacteraceae bacterium]